MGNKNKPSCFGNRATTVTPTNTEDDDFILLLDRRSSLCVGLRAHACIVAVFFFVCPTNSDLFWRSRSTAQEMHFVRAPQLHHIPSRIRTTINNNPRDAFAEVKLCALWRTHCDRVLPSPAEEYDRFRIFSSFGARRKRRVNFMTTCALAPCLFACFRHPFCAWRDGKMEVGYSLFVGQSSELIKIGFGKEPTSGDIRCGNLLILIRIYCCCFCKSRSASVDPVDPHENQFRSLIRLVSSRGKPRLAFDRFFFVSFWHAQPPARKLSKTSSAIVWCVLI